jgi:hypothetical protein
MLLPAVSPLSPEQFDQYSTQWVSTITSAHPDVLDAAFNVKNHRALYARFPIGALTSLLSTVGVHQVKTRFLLVPQEDPNASRFAVALFAANALNERVSGYYLADALAAEPAALPEQSGGVPTPLAAQWLARWQEAAAVAPAFFATSAGPLEGYNFTLADFLAPLRAWDSFSDLELQLGFGLHEYVGPATDAGVTQTFGLLLRVYHTPMNRSSGLENLGTPCPPMH